MSRMALWRHSKSIRTARITTSRKLTILAAMQAGGLDVEGSYHVTGTMQVVPGPCRTVQEGPVLDAQDHACITRRGGGSQANGQRVPPGQQRPGLLPR